MSQKQTQKYFLVLEENSIFVCLQTLKPKHITNPNSNSAFKHCFSKFSFMVHGFLSHWGTAARNEKQSLLSRLLWRLTAQKQRKRTFRRQKQSVHFQLVLLLHCWFVSLKIVEEALLAPTKLVRTWRLAITKLWWPRRATMTRIDTWNRAFVD